MDFSNNLSQIADNMSLQQTKSKYCYYFDNRSKQEFLSLFTTDAEIYIEEELQYENQEGVENFFESIDSSNRVYWSHMIHNPIIEIEDDTATGFWNFAEPIATNDEFRVIFGVYEDRFKRESDSWKIDRMKIEIQYEFSGHHLESQG